MLRTAGHASIPAAHSVREEGEDTAQRCTYSKNGSGGHSGSACSCRCRYGPGADRTDHTCRSRPCCKA